ncbi:hypothetical protein CC78DRAFT_92425 [Lojkania enalia]|uniref:Uncharacterized protein n=1 Tax=Lojkania enalia TaxID=147567 RepID=A0A9P4KDD6_9PLEO|nr:hypothetical protein CC78DRAFT_92425 [Didymosphaeria enalia]
MVHIQKIPIIILNVFFSMLINNSSVIYLRENCGAQLFKAQYSCRWDMSSFIAGAKDVSPAIKQSHTLLNRGRLSFASSVPNLSLGKIKLI